MNDIIRYDRSGKKRVVHPVHSSVEIAESERVNEASHAAMKASYEQHQRTKSTPNNGNQ